MRARTAALAVALAMAMGGPAGAQELPAACNLLYISGRDLYLHFTAWEEKEDFIRGRLKNTHPFETAGGAAIRFTFSLNPQGGGHRGSYCIVLGDIPAGAEVPFEFVRPEAVRGIPHVKPDPHALW